MDPPKPFESRLAVTLTAAAGLAVGWAFWVAHDSLQALGGIVSLRVLWADSFASGTAALAGFVLARHLAAGGDSGEVGVSTCRRRLFRGLAYPAPGAALVLSVACRLADRPDLGVIVLDALLAHLAAALIGLALGAPEPPDSEVELPEDDESREVRGGQVPLDPDR